MKKAIIQLCVVLLSGLVYSVNGFITTRRVLPDTNGNTANFRLSLAEPSSYYIREPEGPGTYSFGYEIYEPSPQFRDEERHPDGSVTGKYGYTDPDGTVRIVNYVADKNGYRANVETIPKRPVPVTTPKPIEFYPQTQLITQPPKNEIKIPLPGIVQPQRPLYYNTIGQTQPLRRPQQRYTIVPHALVTYQTPHINSYQAPIYRF